MEMEIEPEPTFQNVTWIVRDFLELPQENDFYLDSHEFLFSGDTYCLRLYPNINQKGKHETAFHVRRLRGIIAEREVSCKIGLRTREKNGEEHYTYKSVSLEENNSYARSLIKENREEYVPYKSLTVVCTMWLKEESRAGSSAQGEEMQGGFTGLNGSFYSRRNSAKMEVTTEFPCSLVQLTVHRIFNRLRETGDSLSSSVFYFAGDSYCFRFEANEKTADTDLTLVRLTSTVTEKTVSYRVGYGGSELTKYPSNSRSLVGSTGFCVSLSTLNKERNKYAQLGDLELVLFLRLGEQSRAGAGTSDAVYKSTGLSGIHKLQSDYRQLLQKGTVSDACVVVQKKEFPVHRVVLCARSTVFAAMFDHDMTEKKSGRVVVDDLDPDTFRDFLEYLYTGVIQTRLTDDKAYGLYIAADKYNVSTLKLECVEHISRILTVDSFCDVLTLAQAHNEEDLLQQSFKFFKDNLKRIIVTEKWKQFHNNDVETVDELLIKALV